MLGDGALAFREFAVNEEWPLAAIHDAILQFLRERTDAVIFGAQAVNAYVDEPRMTQDVDLLSVRAAALAEELRASLAERFHIAVRICEAGLDGHRLYQVRQPKNRHLADVRQVPQLPSSRSIAGVLVLAPADLVAEKVIAYHRRRGQPKAGTDWRDVASLLLTFPDLKAVDSPVFRALTDRHADEGVIRTWVALVEQEILPEDEN